MAIPTTIINSISDIVASTSASMCVNGLVEMPNGTLYQFYVDINFDPCFKKSTDYGKTWSAGTALKNTTATQLVVWYDRWSGINADLIHCAYVESATDDVFYRSVDAANSDTLSTEVVIFAGDTATGGLNIGFTRTRGGNLLCCGTIDNGTETFAKKSANVGATWSDISNPWEAASDQMIFMPGWATDNQDAMCFYWDSSADEVSVKFYDDSGNSWAETSLGTSMVENTSTNSSGNWSAAVDLTNSQNVLVAWSATDTANADLRCWKVTEAAQTEVTNVVLNSTDDQILAALSILSSVWRCYYLGASDGSESVNYWVKLYYKESSDQGTTWGSETLAVSNSTSMQSASFNNIMANSVAYKRSYCSIVDVLPDSSNKRLYIIIPFALPRASYQLGM